MRELPAGQHFFKNELAVGDIFGPFSRRLQDLTPFTVEAGKATYLGEILVRRTDCNQPGKTQLTDQCERDSKLFDERMKHLSSEKVVKKLLTSEPYGRAPWASN